MAAIGETREFFLRHQEVNTGVFRDIEPHYPLLTNATRIIVNADGTARLESFETFNRLLEGDVVTASVIEKLLSSVCFKLDASDSATEFTAGIVKVANAAQIANRDIVDDFGFTLMYPISALLDILNKSDKPIEDLQKDLEDVNTKLDTIDGLIDAMQEQLNNLEAYHLPIATNTTLGGVKPDNKTTFVDVNGVLTAPLTGDKTFEFTQPMAVSQWYINHNLNKYPSVTIIDTAGTKYLAPVEYIDRDTLVVYLSSPIGGTAICN